MAAHRQVVAAGVGIAVLNGVDHLRHGDAHGQQAIGIDLGLVLPRGSTEGGDIDDAGYRLDLADNEPVLLRLQLVQAVAGADELIAIDLTDRRFGRELRLKIVRQRERLQPIERLLAVDEVGRVEIKVELDVAQAEDADGADFGQLRRAVQHRFDRNGDLLLHLLRGPCRVLRDELDHRRRWIGIGLDIELRKGKAARGQRHEEQDQDDGAVLQQRACESLHGYSDPAPRSSSAPVLITRSPSFRPPVISTVVS